MSSQAKIDGRPSKATALLCVESIRKRFGSVIALDGVSFTVAQGELFGLLGPNGAGKSTLLSILSGLLDADAGSVTLAGQTVRPDRPDARRILGLAPQDIALYPELTAAENLRFFGRLYDLSGRELELRINDLLAAVRLTDRRGDRVAGFSGGMKRRLNLAAAVLHRPCILFLDEPTAGVDPQSRNHVFEEVRRLNAAGATIVYTSHYMEEVQALCPRVGIIDAGKLVRCEPVADLLSLEESRITYRADAAAEKLLPQLRRLPGVVDAGADAGQFEVRTRAAQSVLPAVLRLLESEQIAATHLELHQPTLERVFLKLTGHELRD